MNAQLFNAKTIICFQTSQVRKIGQRQISYAIAYMWKILIKKYGTN